MFPINAELKSGRKSSKMTVPVIMKYRSVSFLPKYRINKGKNINGSNFVPTESAKSVADQKYRLL